jgi:hypothetical protein
LDKFITKITFETIIFLDLTGEVLKSFSQTPLPHPNYGAKSKFDNVYKIVLCLSESTTKEIEAILA